MAVVLHTAEKPEKKIQINQADVSNKLQVILNHLIKKILKEVKYVKKTFQISYHSEVLFFTCSLNLRAVKGFLICSINRPPFIIYMKFQTVTLWEQYPGFMEHQFLCAVHQNEYLSNSQYVIILARFRDHFTFCAFDLSMHQISLWSFL